MHIAKIMRKKVMKVQADDSIGAIHSIFENVAIHHVLVMEKGKLVGIISDRDIYKIISPFVGTLAEQERDIKMLSKKAHQVMTHKLITVTPDDRVSDAALLLLNHDIAALPVLDKEEKLHGIVSWRDIVKWYIKS